MQISGYIYAVMWLLIAAYLFYLAVKESKFFFILSGFFVFLAGWALANELLPDINLFSGVWGWIYRGVAAVLLLICIAKFLLGRRKS